MTIIYALIFAIFQREAFDLAVASPVSVCQGPPGSGKTRFAAVLVSALTLIEDGVVICCAPSNFAADNLATSLSMHQKRTGRNIRLLRMYSHKRENFCAKNKTKIGKIYNIYSKDI